MPISSKLDTSSSQKSYKEIFEHRGHEYNSANAISATARQREVNTLLELAQFGADKLVMDAPAGGGIVAKHIVANGLKHQDIICVEPAKQFAEGIPNNFDILINELDQINYDPDSVDIFLSLAGLHHIDNRLPIYQEWYRLLKPSGQLVVADVKANTATAEFLNGFVDQHNAMGHQGVFIADQEFSQLLAQSGFNVESDELRNVSWTFKDMQELGLYCKLLFNLEAHTSAAAVAAAVSDVVGVKTDHNGVHMQWQLQYAVATKA